MKKTLMRTSLVLLLILGIAANASAIPFTGNISFSGNALSTPTKAGGIQDFTVATMLTSIKAVIDSVDGQYAGIPVLLDSGTPSVTFSNITYAPPTTPIIPLWSFTYLGHLYNFAATSMTISDRSTNHLDLSGVGIAHIDGFTDSPGTWILTVNSSGTTGSFSSSTSAVPEPLTLILLGSGLLGLAGLRRKLS